MNKIIYLFSIAVLFLNGCNSVPHYSLSGKIDGSDSVMFYLQKREAGKTVIFDSALSKMGLFTMKGGSVNYPQLVQLVAGNSRKRVAFYLENSEINASGTLDSLFNTRFTGSKTQDEYDALLLLNKPLSDKYSKVYLDYQVAKRTNKTETVPILEAMIDSIQKALIDIQKKYVSDHPKSYIVPSVLVSLSYDLNSEEMEGLISGLDTSIVSLPQMKSLTERLKVMKLVEVGQKAPDFTLNDPAGKQVSLSSKTGQKLLLIDFWASWCNPCRQENPNVVKVYSEFHKKGFDVIGVSLDHNKDEWVKAISDDKLTWTHVFDQAGEAAKLYAVYSIPSNFLTDDKGVIIGRNLRGEDLYKRVKEILGK
jgi:peroxiredoxin